MTERTLIDIVFEEVQIADHEGAYAMISFEEKLEFNEIDELRRASMDVSEPARLTYSSS